MCRRSPGLKVAPVVEVLLQREVTGQEKLGGCWRVKWAWVRVVG